MTEKSLHCFDNLVVCNLFLSELKPEFNHSQKASKRYEPAERQLLFICLYKSFHGFLDVFLVEPHVILTLCHISWGICTTQ